MKAGKPSATAKLIAAATILLSADRRTSSLVPPDAAGLSQALLDLTPGGSLLGWSARNSVTRRLWRLVERLTHPGIIAHYWHRKHWIELQCREAVAAGFSRVLVIGAGFDTLAWRLARERDDLELVEIDHPATQAAKARAMTGMQVKLVPLDLAASAIPDAVQRSDKATIIILEGLLMYLEPEVVEQLLRSLHGMAAAEVHLVFSYMTRWPDGSIGFRPRSALVDRWLSWRAEPFAWAMESAVMSDFLARMGFRVVASTSGSSLSATESQLEGENLVACRRA
ncbi:MAG: class I SAM-dependent methyltransferase [Pseudomonadota bacterium]|nr:class I SAM-dependent methyltransferase [Pseudomonadota bacterium]